MPLLITKEKILYLLYIVNISSEYIYNRIIIISKDKFKLLYKKNILHFLYQ